ncbi:hypothetical protein pb186bvf_011142 [Paramecium bursaria]
MNFIRKLRYQLFYPQKNAKVVYKDELDNPLTIDGLLRQSKDNQIADWDDKYDLQEVRNPVAILNHLEQVQFKYPLNDLVYFLRHLVHISEVHTSKQTITNNINFKHLVNHVKRQLRDGDHERFPFIGSYSYCFKQLDVNDMELWKLMEQKVLDDEYYTNFKESVYALQGFSKLPLIYHGNPNIQQKIDQLYKKIERIVRLTIWEVDMKHYQNICLALAKVNRFDPETFAKLEQHILTNMSLTYQPNQLVDILFSFAKGNQGSKNFYDAIQYVIFKGHMFDRNFFLQNRNDLGNDGYLLAQLMEVYKKAQNQHEEFRLHPDFQGYIRNMLFNNRTIFNLDSAVRCLKSIPAMKLDEQEIISFKIVDKIVNMSGQFQLEQILEFYRWIEQNIQDKQQLPKAAMRNVEQNIIKYAAESSIDDLIILLNYLYDRPNFILNPTQFSQNILKIFESQMNQFNSYQMNSFVELFDKYLITTLNQDQLLLPDNRSIKAVQNRLRDINLLKSHIQLLQ